MAHGVEQVSGLFQLLARRCSPLLINGAIIVALLLVLILAYGYHARLRWKLRHIPGPPPSFIYGNWGMVNPEWAAWSQINWPQKYGPVLRYFVGTAAFIMVSDPDLINQISVSNFATFHDRPTPSFYHFLTWKERNRSKWELSWAKGKRWSSIRRALDPLFTPNYIKKSIPQFNRQGATLIADLDAEKKSGPVSVLGPLFSYTFHNLFFSTYGVGSEAEKPVAKVHAGMWGLFNPTSYPNTYLKACMVFPFLGRVFALFVGSYGMDHPMFAESTWSAAYFDAACLALLCNARKASGKATELEKHMERPKGKLTPAREIQVGAEAEGFEDFKDLTPAEDTFFPHVQELKAKVGKGPNVETVQLTDVQIAYQGNLIMGAGVESVSLCVAYALYELARNMEMQDKLRKEVMQFYETHGPEADLSYNDLHFFEYAFAVMKESLRKYPPVGAHLNAIRVPEKDFKLGGFLIPKGVPVVMNSFGMQWDEKYFPRPKEFLPERFLESGKKEFGPQHEHAFAPFGAGPRRCIGYKLAEAECILSLIAITRKFRYTLDPKHHPPGELLKLRTAWVMKPLDGIWLRMEHL